jgi:ring-1,2-phenylacetyl-CoA epoxidase subunit PaaD
VVSYLSNIDIEEVWSVLHQIEDPELPSLSITDLGLVRDVEVSAGVIRVGLTPTYSGCPATDTIAADVNTALRARWGSRVKVEQLLYPPWTTDWITETGRAKLEAGGITPPVSRRTPKSKLGNPPEIKCPRCHSAATRLISEFGSTACKSAFACESCLEPFEYFKCL